jgi:hypothetical protein
VSIQTPPRPPEAGRHIDRDAIGQRYHGTDTGDRHQAPAHFIVPDDDQQAAMQDTDLFTKHPPGRTASNGSTNTPKSGKRQTKQQAAVETPPSDGTPDQRPGSQQRKDVEPRSKFEHTIWRLSITTTNSKIFPPIQ